MFSWWCGCTGGRQNISAQARWKIWQLEYVSFVSLQCKRSNVRFSTCSSHAVSVQRECTEGLFGEAKEPHVLASSHCGLERLWMEAKFFKWVESHSISCAGSWDPFWNDAKLSGYLFLWSKELLCVWLAWALTVSWGLLVTCLDCRRHVWLCMKFAMQLWSTLPQNTSPFQQDKDYNRLLMDIYPSGALHRQLVQLTALIFPSLLHQITPLTITRERVTVCRQLCQLLSMKSQNASLILVDEEVAAAADTAIEPVLVAESCVSCTTQSSSQVSPCSSQRLCKTEHAVANVRMFLMLLSFFSISNLHLLLRHTKAYSTTARARL